MIYVFALYEISTLTYIVNIVREKKVAYPSCCIGFEMNSCEFARTTIDVHSTTMLFVKSEEHEQEMLSTSFNVTVVKDTTSRKKRMMIINNINSIKKRAKSTQEE